MKLEMNVEERFTVVKLLEEKLDSQISPALKGEFILMNTNGVRNVILNLGSVKYIDSSGLSAILTANRLCRDGNGVMILCELNDHVAKLIKISQLNSVLNVVPTEEEAREAVYMSEIEKEIMEEIQDDESATASLL